MREEAGISSMIKLVKRDLDLTLNRQQLNKGVLIKILYRQNNLSNKISKALILIVRLICALHLQYQINPNKIILTHIGGS
jgi:hypothetical protein